MRASLMRGLVAVVAVALVAGLVPGVAAAARMYEMTAQEDSKVLLNNLRYGLHPYEWMEGEEFRCRERSATAFRCAGIIWGKLNEECVDTVSENYCTYDYKTCRFAIEATVRRVFFVKRPYGCESEPRRN